MLDFLTKRNRRSLELNQNLQFQTPTYVTKNLTSIRNLLAGQKKLTEKDEKNIVTDVLKNLMVSLEKVKVHFNSFSTKVFISRQTVRKILRKHGIKSRNASKNLNLKREHKINRQKWCKLMKNRPFCQ